MKFIKAILVIILCSIPLTVFARSSPDAQIQRAYNRMELSMQLFQEAQQLLEGDVSKSELQSAIRLLIKAGQGFEEAGEIMRQVGPPHVTEEQVLTVDQAVMNCVEFINECNQMLQRMR